MPFAFEPTPKNAKFVKTARNNIDAPMTDTVKATGRSIAGGGRSQLFVAKAKQDAINAHFAELGVPTSKKATRKTAEWMDGYTFYDTYGRKPKVGDVESWNAIYQSSDVVVEEASNIGAFYRVKPTNGSSKTFYGESAWSDAERYASDFDMGAWGCTASKKTADWGEVVQAATMIAADDFPCYCVASEHGGNGLGFPYPIPSPGEPGRCTNIIPKGGTVYTWYWNDGVDDLLGEDFAWDVCEDCFDHLRQTARTASKKTASLPVAALVGSNEDIELVCRPCLEEDGWDMAEFDADKTVNPDQIGSKVDRSDSCDWCGDFLTDIAAKTGKRTAKVDPDSIQVGDRVSYEDQANPLQEGTVIDVDPDDKWNPITVRWDYEGGIEYTDMRQSGWNRVQGRKKTADYDDWYDKHSGDWDYEIAESRWANDADGESCPMCEEFLYRPEDRATLNGEAVCSDCEDKLEDAYNTGRLGRDGWDEYYTRDFDDDFRQFSPFGDLYHEMSMGRMGRKKQAFAGYECDYCGNLIGDEVFSNELSDYEYCSANCADSDEYALERELEAVYAKRKTAEWWENVRPIGDNAKAIMRLADETGDHPLSIASSPVLSELTEDDMADLTELNYHTTVTIIEGLRPDLAGWEERRYSTKSKKAARKAKKAKKALKKQASTMRDGRPCDPEETLRQIGMMNILAISGGRKEVVTNPDGEPCGVFLPVAYGYSVVVYLDWMDTYTVQRCHNGFIKGEVSDVYADEVGEMAYQASCFQNVEFGGHVSGSKKEASDEYGIATCGHEDLFGYFAGTPCDKCVAKARKEMLGSKKATYDEYGYFNPWDEPDIDYNEYNNLSVNELQDLMLEWVESYSVDLLSVCPVHDEYIDYVLSGTGSKTVYSDGGWTCDINVVLGCEGGPCSEQRTVSAHGEYDGSKVKFERTAKKSR